MKITFQNYPFTPILGWSSSRYELFSKCKRQYFYTYYAKYDTSTPLEKLKALKELTSVPLEIGNVIHHVIEGFLRRLQKSDAQIDESRFLSYAENLCDQKFDEKTFLEEYYGHVQQVDRTTAKARIRQTLTNFIQSPTYSWIWMKALGNKENWMIEPGGYGETRIDGMKAYCKMDFLFPVGDELYILDWKTGKANHDKHSKQLMGYALAAKVVAPEVPASAIIPKIVYMNPEISEWQVNLTENNLAAFKQSVKEQTDEMYTFCQNVEDNIPKPIEAFSKCAHKGICKHCPYQEVCNPFEIEEDELPF